MAINKKLISFATQAQFAAQLSAGNIDNRSIVFIEDKKRIWTHGVYFDTSWNYITGTPDTLDGYGITDAAKKINSLYYVEGNTTGTAGAWTGSIPEVTSLYAGLTIAYKIGVAGASTTNLNLNGLGNKLVRRATGNLTTHLPVGTIVLLTYDGTRWVWADYDSNTTYAAMSVAEGTAGTVSTLRTMRADYLKQIVEHYIANTVPSAHTLASHSDVTITSNSTGEILKWNGSKWINNTLAEAGIASTGQLNNYLPLAGGTLTGALAINLGASANSPLSLTSSGVTTSIGSLNSTWFHFNTTATTGFYFYKNIQTPQNITANSFIGNLTGNASSATYASAVTLTADNSSNATRYPLFASAATGNLSPRTDTGFTYNPSTGALTSTSFVGALSGNASTASTATKVNNKLILKFDTGTTENTNLYTYDGSAAKTINITAGSNVSLTKAGNTVTISSTNTVYTHPTTDGNKHVPTTGTSNNGKVLKAGSTAGSISWGNVAFSEITSKPTTLSGYGITDAVNTNKLQVVTELPSIPESGVFYFIKE